ncbi:phospholipase [Pseudomonas sp.]|uniref:phospholipase n=1 Tax=Pseudomonas sp. TaxID=306 RepID=UPI003D6F005D
MSKLVYGEPVVDAVENLFTVEGISLPRGLDSEEDYNVTLLLYPAPHRTIKYHRRPENSVLFEGGEHTAIGDSVVLHFTSSDPGVPAIDVPLRLPNGLRLTYGQIVALGGDFYGIPKQPISDGVTLPERVTRFNAAFDSLATLPASATEAVSILDIMQEEIDAANEAILSGMQPHEAYDKLGDTLSAKWNRITGGGSFASDWVPLGRYLKLAATNWDHFGTTAKLAYIAGHYSAILQAIVAFNEPDPTKKRLAMELAYAKNAFADHFLSDLYSGGHMRTTRKELYDTITPKDVGSLLSRFMHDEDCKFGLNVTNRRNNRWHAYGDKRYFDTVDVLNRLQVDNIVQQSANEVLEAFLTGQPPHPEEYIFEQFVVDLDAVKDHSSTNNYSPLFVYDGKTVLCRNTLADLNDRSWTKNWIGASTLIQLKRYTPNKPTGYLEPPSTIPEIVPDGWQTNTPEPPNWVSGNAVRYAFSYYNGLSESYIGPWSTYTTLQNKFKPTLNVPIDASGRASGRRIFRQFRNGAPNFIGTIEDNMTRVFVDTKA